MKGLGLLLILLGILALLVGVFGIILDQPEMQFLDALGLTDIASSNADFVADAGGIEQGEAFLVKLAIFAFKNRIALLIGGLVAIVGGAVLRKKA